MPNVEITNCVLWTQRCATLLKVSDRFGRYSYIIQILRYTMRYWDIRIFSLAAFSVFFYWLLVICRLILLYSSLLFLSIRFPFRFQLLPAAKNVIIQNTKMNRNTNKCLYIVDTDLDNLYNNNACVNEFNFDLWFDSMSLVFNFCLVVLGCLTNDWYICVHN